MLWNQECFWDPTVPAGLHKLWFPWQSALDVRVWLCCFLQPPQCGVCGQRYNIFFIYSQCTVKYWLLYLNIFLITEFKSGNVFKFRHLYLSASQPQTIFFNSFYKAAVSKLVHTQQYLPLYYSIIRVLKFPHFSLDLLADVLRGDRGLEQKLKFLRQNNFLQ